ncbi:MAG: glycosyltransferase family 9 protein [Chlamydiota bacterium]
MKKAIVLPALGIGDALLMMIASHQLKCAGYLVTTCHPLLGELSSWFPGHAIDASAPDLSEADLILVENDNSEKVRALREMHRPRLSLFYPTYSEKKHGPLHSNDRAFDRNRSMADNIAEATASLLSLPLPSKDNGIAPPEPLTHQKNARQVLIHPMSREHAKNWHPQNFLDLAKQLRKKDFNPLFCVGPHEREQWEHIEEEGFELARIPRLADLAALIYESGYVIGNDSLIGHLASNLNIPTLIIANDAQRMRLWRPGWLQGSLVLPPAWLPNFKFCRWKEDRWKDFISPAKVIRAFERIV